MIYTSLSNTRQQAEIAINEELEPLGTLIQEAFSSIDECAGRLESFDNQFGRVTAIILIKGRNLALGCFSLSLDALAQEAGALFRPLIECLELLTYLRMDPARINEALEDRLPTAGVIAKKIEGKFERLRGYLNTHASHLSLSPIAMAHLVDSKDGKLRRVQVHNTNVLKQNLCTLLAVLIWLAIEAANCTSISSSCVDQVLCDRIDDLKRRAFLQFDETFKR